MKKMMCSAHSIEFSSYCQDCSNYACAMCMDFECKNHYIVPLEDKITELEEKLPHILETYECIKASRSNLKTQLNRTNFFGRKKLFSVKSSISQHFSKLHAIIQSAEYNLLKEVSDTLPTVEYMNNSISMLKKYENDIDDLIKHIQSIKSLSSEYKYDILSMLKKCNEIIELKCCFTNEDSNILQPSITIEEAFCDNLSVEIKNYCKVFGIDRPVELIAVSELSPELKLNFLKRDEVLSSRDSLGSHTSLLSDCTDTPPNKQNSEKCVTKPLMQRTDFDKTNNENIAEVKSIKRGLSEKVYVTIVKNPNHFYVQRLCDQSRLFKMTEEFKMTLNVTQLDKIENVSNGEIYLTFDGVNKEWYRIRIISNISEDTVNAMFLDYGHCDTVEKKSIALVPPKYASVYPLALKCRLACFPVREKWSDDDIGIMDRIVNSCQHCIMNVKVASESILEVDIYTIPESSLEMSISLIEVFTFLNRCILNKNSQVNKLENPLKVTAHYFKNDENTNDLLATDDEVVITNVKCENVVYLRKVDSELTLKEINEKLAEICIANNSMIYMPRQNMCVACCTDTKWFRGKIMRVENHNKIHVYLVDYGTEEVFEWSHLRSLEPSFFKIDELAVKCILSNVKKIAQCNVNGAIDFLNTCSRSWIPQKVEVVKKINDNSFEIILFSLVNGEMVSVCQEFVNRGYIQPVPSSNIINKSNTPEFTKILKSSNINKEIKPIKKQICKIIEKKNVNNEIKSTKTVDDKIYVKILSAKNPSEIYVRLASQKDELHKLFSEIQKFYNNSKPDFDVKWNVADKCIMYSASLKHWHRGIVTKIDEEKDIAEVFLKDVAQLEEGPISELRKIAKEHLNVKDGAIKCYMTDISPATGEIWPNITREYLQEIIHNNKKFYICKDGSIANKSLPIKLWVLHFEAGGALEPCRETWKLVNNMIVEQGLAIRNNVLNETVEQSDTSIEENVTIDEEIVVQKEVVNSTPDIEIENLDLVNIDLIPKPIERWLPPNPPEKIDFVGVPVHIDKDANIYVNIPEENENLLSYVNLEIDKIYGESLPQPEDMFWSEGQPCIAQYPKNKKYYRGIVKSILENNKIEVYFIDYGNIEECHVSTLRKKVITGSVPTQVHKFKICGIEPCTGDTWEEGVLQYIDGLIIGTQCNVTILDKDDQGEVIIKLQIEGSDFRDILQSSNVAKKIKHPMLNVPKPEKKKIEITQENDPDIVLDDNGEEITNAKVINAPQNNYASTSQSKRSQNRKARKNSESKNEKDTTKISVNNRDRKDSTSSIKLPNHSLQETQFCQFVDVCTHDSGIVKLCLDDKSNKKIKLNYESLNKELNKFGKEQLVIDEFSKDMYCIVQLEDNIWYRCVVVKINTDKKELLVHLVDEGTDKYVSFDNARQIKEAWLKIPPMSFIITIRNVKIDDHGIKSSAFLLRVTESPGEKYMIKIVKYNKGIPVVDVSNLKNN